MALEGASDDFDIVRAGGHLGGDATGAGACGVGDIEDAGRVGFHRAAEDVRMQERDAAGFRLGLS